MRLRIILSLNTSNVPFYHIPLLAGTLHKWLGPNTEHGGLSLYSFSWLAGGQAFKHGLQFGQGACWDISARDGDFLRRSIDGIFKDPKTNRGKNIKVEGPSEFLRKVHLKYFVKGFHHS